MREGSAQHIKDLAPVIRPRPVPVDHERQRGRLDAPLPHNADIARVTGFQRHCSCGIYPNKPVRTFAGKRGVVKRGIPCVVFEVRQRVSNRLVVQGGQPEPEYFARVAALFNDFIHQKLAFPVRIASIDHAFGPIQE